VADLTCCAEVIHDAEYFGPVVHLGRRAVQLHQVETISPQVFQTALDEGGQVLAVIAFSRVWVQATSGLGRDVDALAGAIANNLTDQPLAAPIAVDIRSIDEIDPQVDRAVQRGERVPVVYVTP